MFDLKLEESNISSPSGDVSEVVRVLCGHVKPLSWVCLAQLVPDSHVLPPLSRQLFKCQEMLCALRTPSRHCLSSECSLTPVQAHLAQSTPLVLDLRGKCGSIGSSQRLEPAYAGPSVLGLLLRKCLLASLSGIQQCERWCLCFS